MSYNSASVYNNILLNSCLMPQTLSERKTGFSIQSHVLLAHPVTGSTGKHCYKHCGMLIILLDSSVQFIKKKKKFSNNGFERDAKNWEKLTYVPVK